MKKASAVVTFVVRLTVPDRWGSECVVDQIDKQARVSASQTLQHAINKLQGAEIVGTPKVSVVVIEEE